MLSLYWIVTLWLLFHVWFSGCQECRIFSSPARDGTCTPCIERQSLKHWPTREVPKAPFVSEGLKPGEAGQLIQDPESLGELRGVSGIHWALCCSSVQSIHPEGWLLTPPAPSIYSQQVPRSVGVWAWPGKTLTSAVCEGRDVESDLEVSAK